MIKHTLVILVTGLLLGAALPGLAGDLLPMVPEAQDRYSDAQGCVAVAEEGSVDRQGFAGGLLG